MPSPTDRQFQLLFGKITKVGLELLIEIIPDDAPVTVTNVFGGYLSARRYFYSFPVLGRAEWVVLARRDSWIPSTGRIETVQPRRLQAFIGRLERDPAWTKVFDREGVLVFRKAS